MNDINPVAFEVIINWQFIIIVAAILLGAVASILMSGTQYDREVCTIKKLKNFKLMLSYLVGVGIFLLGLLIAGILWGAGVGKIFSRVTVRWYAIMIVTGMIAAIVAAYFMAKKKGLDASIILDLALVVIPLGIIGARLWYVIFPYENGSHNFESFLDVIAIWDGGLGIYGGIIFGAIGVVLVSIWKKINVFKLVDIVAPCVLIAQAIGRWGNFFNMEAHGFEISNSAMQWFPLCVPIGSKWYLATFFYEFLWNSVGFALLYTYLYKYNKIHGLGICGYGVWYGLGRSWIESLRTDSLFIPGTQIRVSIAFSIVLILGGLAFGAYLIWHYRKTGLQVLEKTKHSRTEDEEIVRVQTAEKDKIDVQKGESKHSDPKPFGERGEEREQSEKRFSEKHTDNGDDK